jgi:PKD repeat protein
LPKKKVVFNAVKFLGRKVSWDFGDGTVKVTNAKRVTHLYSKVGKYRVKVRDFGGKGKKLFKGDILVTEILPGFEIERLEFSFNNGKYYKIAQKKQYKLGYKMRIKATGAGILHGKILLDGSVLGLFEIYLNGTDIGYLKNSEKPKLPLNELGMHKLTFEFSNYNFSGQKPFLRYFVSNGKRIILKSPKDNALLKSTEPVKLIWSLPFKKLDYEYAFSIIPFQFLKDKQIKWKKSEKRNYSLIDLNNYKKEKYAYLLIRAKNKANTVKAMSQIYYFRLK